MGGSARPRLLCSTPMRFSGQATTRVSDLGPSGCGAAAKGSAGWAGWPGCSRWTESLAAAAAEHDQDAPRVCVAIWQLDCGRRHAGRPCSAGFLECRPWVEIRGIAHAPRPLPIA